MSAPDEHNRFMTMEEFLKNAKGFDNMPLELQESFQTYERKREAELMKPRPNGGILFPVFDTFPY